MATTYSTNLKLALMAQGENTGTWGTTTNANLGTLLEEGIVGYTTQALTGNNATTTLTILDGTASPGRNYVIEFTGSPTGTHTVIVPTVDKPYIFFNNTTLAILVKTSAGSGVTIAIGKKAIVYTNSTNVVEVANAPVTEEGTQTLTNKTLIGGTGVSSGLILQSTSGVGTSDSISLKVGDNGATTAVTVNTSGSVGIGSSSLTGYGLRNSKTVTGATASYANYSDGIVQSGVTTGAFYYTTSASTVASAFTTANLVHYAANQSTIGAGSVVTAQTGFSSGASLIGGTTNYGFYAADTAAVTAAKTAYGYYSAINTATGGGTAYGVYAAGTAVNYLRNLSVGTTAAPGTFNVSGTATAQYLSRYSTDATAPVAYVRKARGTEASPTIVVNGDDIGQIDFQGYDGTTFVSAAQILAEVDDVPGATDMPGRLVFKTTPNGSGTLTTQVTIDNAGIVTGTAGNLMLVSAAAQTFTAVTSIAFTDLPSWVKRVTVMFAGTSFNTGTSVFIVQLGTGATPTYTTSGYVGNTNTPSGGTQTSWSSGIILDNSLAAADITNGTATLTNLTSNTWMATTASGYTTNNTGRWGAGSIALAAPLTALRLTTAAGTSTFDAGTFNILYE